MRVILMEKKWQGWLRRNIWALKSMKNSISSQVGLIGRIQQELTKTAKAQA
jgi:hypothetical protein